MSQLVFTHFGYKRLWRCLRGGLKPHIRAWHEYILHRNGCIMSSLWEYLIQIHVIISLKKMQQRNVPFALAAICKKGNMQGAKPLYYIDVGQSHERDLLTHIASTSSGADCWIGAHPLPHNPTRDDLVFTRAMLLDLTRTQMSVA